MHSLVLSQRHSYLSPHAIYLLASGVLLFIEIQKGKIPMQKMKYSKELGGTAACTARLVEGSQYSGTGEEERIKSKRNGKREIIKADSWFTGRKSCKKTQELGHEYFGALKTNHSGCPKEEIEAVMKDWPSGSYLVVECKQLKLFMIGYKYSFKKKGKHCQLLCLKLNKTTYICSSLLLSLLLPWDLGLWIHNTWPTLHCKMAR